MKVSVAYKFIDKPNAKIKNLNIPSDVINGEDFDTEIEIELAVLAYLMAELNLNRDDLQKLEMTWKVIE